MTILKGSGNTHHLHPLSILTASLKYGDEAKRKEKIVHMSVERAR